MSNRNFITTRRQLLKAAGGTAVALATPGVVSRALANDGAITVADPGGPFSAAFRTAFYGPFEEATGIRVLNVAREAEPSAQFKAMVEAQTYTWDVCNFAVSIRDIVAKEGLLEPIGFTAQDVPGLMEGAISEDWMGTDVFSTVFAYSHDHFKDDLPKNWADFWNVEKFPGRRSLRRNSIDTLEQALLADGVPLDQLYPLDLDRAFKSLDRIKPHIAVWWTGGAQSTQLLHNGEVDLIAGWNARLQAAIDGGAPATIVWDQGFYSIEGWAIPRGTPRAAQAKEFIKFCADAERQASFTNVLAYGPTNLDAYKSIPAERARVLPTAPENLSKMRMIDQDWWSEHRDSATERFNSWLLT